MSVDKLIENIQTKTGNIFSQDEANQLIQAIQEYQKLKEAISNFNSTKCIVCDKYIPLSSMWYAHRSNGNICNSCLGNSNWTELRNENQKLKEDYNCKCNQLIQVANSKDELESEIQKLKDRVKEYLELVFLGKEKINADKLQQLLEPSKTEEK